MAAASSQHQQKKGKQRGARGGQASRFGFKTREFLTIIGYMHNSSKQTPGFYKKGYQPAEQRMEKQIIISVMSLTGRA